MAKLISKRYLNSNSDVYDIEVADNHNYFAEDILVHNCSPSSKQGRQILKLKKDTENAKVEWLPMTGTPIVNKPTDVFTPLKLVNGHTFNNYRLWCQNFCVYGGFGGYDIIGYKNIPQLKQMLFMAVVLPAPFRPIRP